MPSINLRRTYKSNVSKQLGKDPYPWRCDDNGDDVEYEPEDGEGEE